MFFKLFDPLDEEEEKDINPKKEVKYKDETNKIL